MESIPHIFASEHWLWSADYDDKVYLKLGLEAYYQTNPSLYRFAREFPVTSRTPRLAEVEKRIMGKGGKGKGKITKVEAKQPLNSAAGVNIYG